MPVPEDDPVRTELTESRLAQSALTICPLCCLSGPVKRVHEHLEIDHARVDDKDEWTLKVGGRFRETLNRLAQQFGISVRDIAEAALTTHLLHVGRDSGNGHLR